MGTCFTMCCSSRTILDNQPESSTPEPEETFLVSLYDYPSFEHTELTMHMGERLTVVSDDGDFMMVRSAITGRESYISVNYTAKVTHSCSTPPPGVEAALTWLFTGTSRYKAEELLKHPNNQSGAFLIRESETHRDCYSLSLLRRSSSSSLNPVKHYRISHLENSWVYISPGLTFPSLRHLVEHYSDAADGLCCRLIEPCFVLGLDRDVRPVPITVRIPTINWKDTRRSLILRRKRTESDNSLVSDGLREAISSYLQMTECKEDFWDT